MNVESLMALAIGVLRIVEKDLLDDAAMEKP